MKILNFGSLNIDYVYSVDHFVQKGETISSSQMNIFSGGKGLNQSVALGRAGAKVFHAGRIGKNGEFLVANQRITKEQIDAALEQFDAGDYLVLQNEISNLPYLMEKAAEKQMKIVLNPSPMDEKIKAIPFDKLTLFFGEYRKGCGSFQGYVPTGCSRPYFRFPGLCLY